MKNIKNNQELIAAFKQLAPKDIFSFITQEFTDIPWHFIEYSLYLVKTTHPNIIGAKPIDKSIIYLHDFIHDLKIIGADLNYQDCDGNTASHYFIESKMQYTDIKQKKLLPFKQVMEYNNKMYLNHVFNQNALKILNMETFQTIKDNNINTFIKNNNHHNFYDTIIKSVSYLCILDEQKFWSEFECQYPPNNWTTLLDDNNSWLQTMYKHIDTIEQIDPILLEKIENNPFINIHNINNRQHNILFPLLTKKDFQRLSNYLPVVDITDNQTDNLIEILSFIQFHKYTTTNRIIFLCEAYQNEKLYLKDSHSLEKFTQILKSVETLINNNYEKKYHYEIEKTLPIIQQAYIKAQLSLELPETINKHHKKNKL